MIQPAPPKPHDRPAFFPAERLSRDNWRRMLQASAHRSRVMVCLDNSDSSRSVMGHALAIARSLELPVTLARVMETPRRIAAPADPVEWQLRRSSGRDQLEQLAQRGRTANEVESVLLAGRPVEELSRWAQDHDVSLMVIGTQDFEDGPREGLGATALKLLAQAEASLLLIPPVAPQDGERAYHRLLVPLDGSSRAESVLPIAIRIARAHHAELVLAHVVPQLEIVRSSPLEPSTRELRDRLDQRNDEDAHAYLEALGDRMSTEDLPVRTIVTRDGDARAQLRRLTMTEGVDLIIVSSHGSSGLADMPCGSVTEYLASHAPAPLLIVRPTFTTGFGTTPDARPGRVERATH